MRPRKLFKIESLIVDTRNNLEQDNTNYILVVNEQNIRHELAQGTFLKTFDSKEFLNTGLQSFIEFLCSLNFIVDYLTKTPSRISYEDALFNCFVKWYALHAEDQLESFLLRTLISIETFESVLNTLAILLSKLYLLLGKERLDTRMTTFVKELQESLERISCIYFDTMQDLEGFIEKQFNQFSTLLLTENKALQDDLVYSTEGAMVFLQHFAVVFKYYYFSFFKLCEFEQKYTGYEEFQRVFNVREMKVTKERFHSLVIEQNDNPLNRLVSVEKFKNQFFDHMILLNEETKFSLVHNKFSRGKTVRQSREQLISLFRPTFVNEWSSKIYSTEDELTYESLSSIKNADEPWWQLFVLLVFKLRFRSIIHEDDPVLHCYASPKCKNARFENIESNEQSIGIMQYFGYFIVFLYSSTRAKTIVYSRESSIERALIAYLVVYLLNAYNEAHDPLVNDQVRLVRAKNFVDLKQMLFTEFLQSFCTAEGDL
jgi:hypothetical protein